MFNRRKLCLLVAAFAIFACAEPGLADATMGSAVSAPIDWTPIVIRSSTEPQLFQGGDNKYNLVYEILLQSAHNAPITLKKFEVIDPHTKKVLKQITDKDIDAVFNQFDGSKGITIKRGIGGIVWVNIEFDSKDEVPDQLWHRLTYSALGFDKKQQDFTSEGAETAVNKQPAIVVGAPLRGGKWLATGGYNGKLGHRRALFPISNRFVGAQRFAIDWLRMDEKNYSHNGDKTKNDTSLSYAQPILAIADGTVYGVTDKFSEQVKFTVKGDDIWKFPAGNSITLDLGNGRYAMYAHLKPGSIKVKAGDKVKKGDVIANLGNSGNSSEPHLHMHITDDPHILGSNGVPYAFETFNVIGEVKDLDAYVKLGLQSKPQVISETKFKGTHEKELPCEGQVMQFPE